MIASGAGNGRLSTRKTFPSHRLTARCPMCFPSSAPNQRVPRQPNNTNTPFFSAVWCLITTPQCNRVSFNWPITPSSKDILLFYSAENVLLARLVASLHTKRPKTLIKKQPFRAFLEGSGTYYATFAPAASSPPQSIYNHHHACGPSAGLSRCRRELGFRRVPGGSLWCFPASSLSR